MNQFTLQLEPRPPGRPMLCEQCGRVDMHPENVQQVACRDCSPFLAVRHDPKRGRLEVVCRWAKSEAVIIGGVTDVEAWAITQGDVPRFVVEALSTYFDKHPKATIRVLPESAGALKADVQIDVSGVITMEVDRDVQVGDVLTIQNTPIGVAASAAKAGELVEVQLGVTHAPAKAKSPAREFLEELARDQEGDDV